MAKHIRILASLLTLAACTTPLAQKPSESLPTTTPVPFAAPAPITRSAALPLPRTSNELVPPAEIHRGSARFIEPHTAANAVTPAPEDGTTLNFVNADIADVARAVLGDLLKLNYLVDSGVQGSVTLQTSRPLPTESVLPAFEQAIRLSGLALVQRDGIYRVIPLSDAPRNVGPLGTGPQQAAGFGVEIVPLRYVGVAEMQKLLEPLAPRDSVLHADPARNLLMIAGSERERAAIVENIHLFDFDWMAGMSFAVLPLKQVDAKTLVTELKEVMGKESPFSSMVRLVPIGRINSILAISPQPKYLDQLARWVERLDRVRESASQRIYVYYVQNGRATDLAGVLNKVLTGSGGQGTASETKGLSEPDAAGSTAGSSSTPNGTAALGSPGLFGQAQSKAAPPLPSESPLSGDEGGEADRKAPKIRITADQTSNALLIYATPADYAIVEAALAKLDIAPLQVLLEAAVAEVDLTKDMNYGVQYSFLSGSSHAITLSNGTSGTVAPTYPGFNYMFTSGKSIAAVLSALQDIAKTNLLSTPEVLVLNNQTASLQVGDQVPISTGTATSTLSTGAPLVTTIEYKDTGVILKVTPRVNESGLVLMDISQEVSDVSSVTSSSLDSPTISERKISTTVAVQDGETIALGGLFKDQTKSSRGGVPWLQDIPIAGTLFSSSQNSVNRQELLVLITPHVVQGVQKLRDATEEIRNAIPEARDLFDHRQR